MSETITTQQSTVTTVTEAQTASQGTATKRNRLKDVPQKISRLREMAKEGGWTRERVCKEMSIEHAQFDRLRLALMDEDKKYYEFPIDEATRRNRVRKHGINITSDKLTSLGAAAIFPEGTTLHTRFENGCLIIEPEGTTTPTVNQNEESAVKSSVDTNATNTQQNANSGEGEN